MSPQLCVSRCNPMSHAPLAPRSCPRHSCGARCDSAAAAAYKRRRHALFVPRRPLPPLHGEAAKPMALEPPLGPEGRFPGTKLSNRPATSRACAARGRCSRDPTKIASASPLKRLEPPPPSPPGTHSQSAMACVTAQSEVEKSAPSPPQPALMRIALPLANSVTWQPAAQTSSRSSKGWPRLRSGEKYCGQPATCDISRGPASSS
mmetsp:Transcript_92823/g.242174  ORF Transcript_92823/g.242174 Transcript_92823/m.242174 type:complete len:205 (+) Transcript_92823:298-912(+)